MRWSFNKIKRCPAPFCGPKFRLRAPQKGAGHLQIVYNRAMFMPAKRFRFLSFFLFFIIWQTNAWSVSREIDKIYAWTFLGPDSRGWVRATVTDSKKCPSLMIDSAPASMKVRETTSATEFPVLICE